MRSYKYFFVVIGIMVSAVVSGQSFETFIKSMHADHSQWSRMHIVMDVLVYDSAETIPYYNEQANIKRDGDNYWYKYENNEMLLTKKYLIILDRNSRQITCSKRSLEAEQQLSSHFKFDIDSVLSLYPTPEFLGVKDGLKHFKFFQAEGLISEVHFYITENMQRLSSMEYRYRGGQLARMLFHVFRYDMRFEPETFAESRYVSFEKETIRPSRHFQQYRVVDLTNRVQ